METPTTHLAQLTALITSLGGGDFNAATAAIGSLQTQKAGWEKQSAALFAALGGSGPVPEHYDFAAAISGLITAQQALFSALGVTDHAAAVSALGNLNSQVNSLQANQTTLFAALGATDLAGAMRAIKDIDGRIEAGVTSGVIARAAAAGLTNPVDKIPGEDKAGGAKSVTRAEFAAMLPKQQLEFSQAGGQVVAE